ncbi:indolepyruvate ferredoxin oxidoreductase family protein [Sneathiella chinensis]|uniref:MFS transporter n=1 Tax=Sneathiella chinensis TaxID=349750 RepID=A0ABQ5U1F6_9PROT|nr:indolepyruvate ferredoxin oxidoreductase family protein [Sneathiella chinensis]GLQ05974.1 MFS transporter [Sneathiella chinensis]
MGRDAITIGPELASYKLADRYLKSTGRVFLTGTQALVRVALQQSLRDQAAGLETAGFISGYRGSPLGAVDQELWRIKDLLADRKIEFVPAVNEELAATAVLGSQQVETDPHRTVDGVFGLWYGKGPGVDRAGDALKHGNAYGSSPHGGVLVVAGDDHGSVSSSMPYQSDVAFITFFMPILNPSNVAEYLSFGEYGYALSRYSGMWVGFKATTETVESGMSVDLPAPRQFKEPVFTMPETGLHYRWPDFPGPQIEERLEAKKHAVFAFAEANPIDRHIYDIPHATYGIVTTGKAHLDLMEALRLLGIGEEEARRIGIDIYKIGLVWPLAKGAALDFVRGKREVLVIEEKRAIIESQFKEYFYDTPGSKPACMVGKHDEAGNRLIPWTGELSPRQLAGIVARRLDGVFPDLNMTARAKQLEREVPVPITVAGATRTPYFCSGCPHNRSTRVPTGSQALAGIGCHFMASWMNRETGFLIQMGGEGVNWIAKSRFNGNRHIFQNLGDGTYYHSGLLAIRQAVAAKANITYKILYNDATAMTGGQPFDGPLSVPSITQSLRAEGISRIAVVSDHIEKFRKSDFPEGVTFDDRGRLDAVQRELRDIPGVTALVYEQTCATEKRRRRKRGKMEDPARFAYINAAVCEGCGDCSVASNCLSVEPRETPLGRKRQINLNSCNKDFSCLDGFCPSFVTIEGGRRRKPEGKEGAGEGEDDYHRFLSRLPSPQPLSLQQPFNLIITGVGGTGVITVGQLVTMAAHLEGKGASVLDFMGFAQKFGPVISYVRLGATPQQINQVRIDQTEADALIGCDLVVSTSPKASVTYGRGRTRAALNTAIMPTGDFTLNPDADLKAGQRQGILKDLLGAAEVGMVDANFLSEKLLGDSVYANVLLLGFAWQRGLVPVTVEALMRAIELNGVAVDANKRAFNWGRILAHDPDMENRLEAGEHPAGPQGLDEWVDYYAAFLTDYQDKGWANRYRAFVQQVRDREKALGGAGEELTLRTAKSLFRLMSYKDEYEVARLHMGAAFQEEIRAHFEGDYRIVHHLAPPFLPKRPDERGHPGKRRFGPWIRGLFPGLAALKGLRGTPFDPFGYTAERRMERGLIDWYRQAMETVLDTVTRETVDQACSIANIPLSIRGFGPVKEKNVQAAKARMKAELAAFLNPPEGRGE